MFLKALPFLAIALGVITISAEEANAQSELVKLVTKRQGLMFDMQTAYWTLFNVNEGRSTDLSGAAEGAQTINDALDKFLLLLPSGTAQSEVPGSRAKPEIWTQAEEFDGAAKILMEANGKLIESAKSGDLDAFRQRFEAVAQACVGCHDFKPSKGASFVIRGDFKITRYESRVFWNLKNRTFLICSIWDGQWHRSWHAPLTDNGQDIPLG